MTRPSGPSWSSVSQQRAHEAPVGHLEHGLQPVARRLVGARTAGRCRHRPGVVVAAYTSRMSRPAVMVFSTIVAPRVPGRGRPRRPRGPAAAARCAAVRRWRTAWPTSAGRPRARGPAARARGGRRRRRARRGGRSRSHSSSIRRCSGSSASPDSGTWWARLVPSTCLPSTTSGPVQPLGVRRTIAGHGVPHRLGWPSPPAGGGLDLADPVVARGQRPSGAPGRPRAGRRRSPSPGPSPGCAGRPRRPRRWCGRGRSGRRSCSR